MNAWVHRIEATSGDRALVALGGEIDRTNGAALFDELDGLRDGASDVVVDLSDVQFMDSHVLHLLVGLAMRLRNAGGDVALVAPLGGIARKLLQITGLDEHFATVTSMPE